MSHLNIHPLFYPPPLIPRRSPTRRSSTLEKRMSPHTSDAADANLNPHRRDERIQKVDDGNDNDLIMRILKRRNVNPPPDGLHEHHQRQGKAGDDDIIINIIEQQTSISRRVTNLNPHWADERDQNFDDNDDNNLIVSILNPG